MQETNSRKRPIYYEEKSAAKPGPQSPLKQARIDHASTPELIPLAREWLYFQPEPSSNAHSFTYLEPSVAKPKPKPAPASSSTKSTNGVNLPREKAKIDLSKEIERCKKMVAENQNALAYFKRKRLADPRQTPPQLMQQAIPSMGAPQDLERKQLPQIERYSSSALSSPPKTISVQNAEALRDQGQYFESLIILEELLIKNPSNSQALFLKINISSCMIPADYIMSAEIFLLEIKDLINQRRCDEALKKANLILKILPKEKQYQSIEITALLYQAKSYRKLGRLDESRNSVAEVLAKDPSDKLAMKYKFKDFLEYANTILVKDPKNKLALESKIDAINSIINILLEQQKAEKALRKVDSMISINPNPLYVMMKRFDILKKENKLLAASKISKQAIQKCHENLIASEHSHLEPKKICELQNIQSIWKHLMRQLQIEIETELLDHEVALLHTNGLQ